MRIWIIRHGESDGNLNKVFSTKSNLTTKGIAQAEWIKGFLDDKCIDALYVSPVPRALQAAEIIAEGLKKKPIVCGELREIEYGKLENRTYAYAEKNVPEVFSSNPNGIISVKYPEGETYQDVYNRVRGWLSQTKTKWHRKSNIAIITHSLIAKIFIPLLLDLPIDMFVKFKIKNGSILCIEIKNDIGYLLEFNRQM